MMDRERSRNQASSGGRAEALQELLDAAKERPGVKEMTQVFSVWRKFEDVAVVQRQVDISRRVVSLSDTSLSL